MRKMFPFHDVIMLMGETRLSSFGEYPDVPNRNIITTILIYTSYAIAVMER